MLIKILGKTNFTILFFKYYDFIKDLDYTNEEEFLHDLENLSGNYEERFLEAAKKYMTRYSNEYLYQVETKQLKLKTISLNNNIHNLEEYGKKDIFPRHIQLFISDFGIKNILRLEEETGFFSKKISPARFGTHLEMTINIFAKAYFQKENWQITRDITSYEEFLEKFFAILKKCFLIGYSFDTLCLKEKYEYICPELFIDNKAPSKLKELFYTHSLDSTSLFKHPQYIPYLLNKELNELFSCKIKVNDTLNLSDIVDKKFYLELLSKYCLNTQIKIDLKEKDYKNYPLIESIIREKLFNLFPEADYFFVIPEFLDEHPELKLESKDKTLQRIVSRRRLNKDDVRKHSKLTELLKGKDLKTLFNLNDYLANLLDFLGEDLFLKLVNRYGNSLDLVDRYFIYEEDLINTLDEFIINKLLDGEFYDLASIPDFIKEKAPYLFISEDAPKILKRYFYGYYMKDVLTFKMISENKEWLKYLKGKTLKQMFIKSGNPYLKENYKKYFSLFGEHALRLGLSKPELIDTIIYKMEMIDLAYEWFLASSKSFIPSKIVLENFPIDEASHFFENARWWSKLMNIKRYSNSYEVTDGLLKMAYVFGVFEGNIQGFNILYKILTHVPSEFVLNRESGNKFADLINSNLVIDFLEACEQENFNLDYIKKVDDKYKLCVLNEKYPRSLAIIRESIEYKVDDLLSPFMLHTYFSGFNMKYSEDFLNFLIKNFDKFFTVRPSYVASIQKNFEKIKHLNSGRKLTWQRAIDYVKNITYDNVELGNEYMANVVSKAGVSNTEFLRLQSIYDIGKMRCFSSIPRITGNLGNYTYEILRLDDPLALVIGTLTDCCQEIGNVAESCMIHGMTSENGRIFVVRDNDKEIVAQSWVWRNRNVICFDNIEVPNKMFDKHNGLGNDILRIYEEASSKLMMEDKNKYISLLKGEDISQEQYDGLVLRKVTVGLGYNDIASEIEKELEKDTGFSAVPYEEEKMLNLYSCDSDEQYILASDGKNINCSLPNIAIYNDEYVIYDYTNFDNEKLTNLKNLEVKMDRYSNIIDACDCNGLDFDALQVYYDLQTRPYIIMNNNFAIIYEVGEEINIIDIFASLDQSDKVLKQIEIALNEIKENKKLNSNRLENKALEIYNLAQKEEVITLKREIE